MSQADDLLARSTGASARLANVDMEPHIVVDTNRHITVPEELKRLGVQHDHDIETVTFDCPRYWDGHDMSKMAVYINYMTPVGKAGAYMAENISVDDVDSSVMHFTWTISGHVTENKGKLQFLVCVKKTDGDGMVVNHWNSELCESAYISEGLETEELILQEYPDLVTQLLLRMDAVEELATPEVMQGYAEQYVEQYLQENDPKIQAQIEADVQEYLDSHESDIPGQIKGYVDDYFDNHNPWFVVGPDEPNRACLWFNTTSTEELTEFDITETSEGGEVFAMLRDGSQIDDFISSDVDSETVTADITEEPEEPKYDFTII